MSETNVQVALTADDAELTAALQSAAATVSESTEQMGGSLKEMAATATAASEETTRSISAAATESKGLLAGLSEQVKLTGESFETLHARLSIFSDAAGAFGEFVLAGLGIEQVADAVKDVAETGEQLLHLSDATGVSTEALSGLRLASIEAGSNFDTVSSAVLRLANNMETALKTKTSSAAEAFTALFGSTENMRAALTNADGTLKDTGQVLQETADQLAKYADGGDKAAIEMGIFGMRGAELIPVLNQLQADGGLAGATEKVHELGGAFSQAAAEADEQFMVAMHDSGQALGGVRDEVSQAVIPAITALVQGFGEGGAGSQLMATAVDSLIAALKGLVGTFSLVQGVVGDVIDVFYAVGEEMGDLINMSRALSFALVGDFKDAQTVVSYSAHQMAADYESAVQGMVNNTDDFIKVLDALKSTAGAGLPDFKPPTLPPAPTITVPGDAGGGKAYQNNLNQIAQDGAQERTQIAQLEYTNQVDVWDAEVAQNKISKSQEIQDEINAKDQEYTAEMAALQAKAEIYANGTAAKAKALDDETVLELQHNDDILKLDAQLAEEQQKIATQTAAAQKAILAQDTKDFQAAFAPITAAFDQTVNGVLQGTETMQQGIAKAAQSIILSFIDASVKSLASWTASELGKLAATANSQAGITAINAQGRAIEAASNMASIANAAHVAAAKAYSAVAGIPYVGPFLAPAAAALAYAGVMAFDVISAEGGAAQIGADGTMAVLHQNEMVLPASIADPLRSSIASGAVGGGAGGGSTSAGNSGDFNATFAPVINLPSGSAATSSQLKGVLAQQSQQFYQYLQTTYFRNGALTLPGR